VFGRDQATTNVEQEFSIESLPAPAFRTGGLSYLPQKLSPKVVYGLLAYMVGQRSREIGLRMALGARRWDVLKLILGKGVALAGAGIVAGMIFSAATASLMASLLYGVRPHDSAVFLVVPLLLFVIAVVASYIPARRATRVDPMRALREA
jgi:ABC-type antimicrobial peptide transport system permease subunit